MYLDKKKILSSLTKEDIIRICDYFGHGTYKQSGNGMGFSTALCHGGDSPHKLVLYAPDRTPYWRVKCFTCGDSYDIVELVIRASRNQGRILTWYKALNLIAQLTGRFYESDISSVKIKKIDFQWIDRIRALKGEKRAIPRLDGLNENILECFYYGTDLLEEWMIEGISAQTLGEFEIGYYPLTNQITIPHRNWQTNELIGIRGRYVRDEDVEYFGKYIPIFINGKVCKHALGNTLYGLWRTKFAIMRTHKIMLVEAEKSVLLAQTYFGDDNNFTAAVCGSNITQTQMRIMLQELKVEEVMIAFDREYHEADSFEAEIYWQKLVKKVAPLIPFCKVYLILDTKHRIPYKGSPLDMGVEILKELMKEKFLITQEEVVRIQKGKR